MATIIHGGIPINTDEISKEDMPTPLFEDIYDVCGAETAVLLLKHFTGNIINVPSKGMFKIEEKLIRREFDGTSDSIRKMARKYKITEGTVRNILARTKVDIPIEGQLDLGLL